MKIAHLYYAFITIAILEGCSYDTLNPLGTTTAHRIATTTTNTSQASDLKQKDFNDVMQRLVSQIKANPDYRKIGFKTPEEKQWFKTHLYKLWHRDMTRNDFIAQGVKRYPTKRYEFTFIADAMQRI